jgi:acetyl esterase/lipase
MRLPTSLPLMRALLAFSVAFALSGCSGIDALNALTPKNGYQVERDIAYGDDPRQRYDLYIPDNAAENAPIVVFFYGGGWDSGHKEAYLFAAQAFVARGYVTAIPDYRLYPQARYPAFVDDGAMATRAVADRFPKRTLLLAGHSAGAYIAMMTAANAALPVDAVVGLAGPYDFLPLRTDRLRNIFGGEPVGLETQPIHRVTAAMPPTLLIHGTADTTVYPRNSVALAARLKALQTAVSYLPYEGVGHARLVAGLAAPLRSFSPVLDDIDRFFKMRVKGDKHSGETHGTPEPVSVSRRSG